MTRLQEEKAALAAELQTLKRTTVQSRLTSDVSQRELTLAAFDQVTDLDLTNKLLQKRLKASGLFTAAHLLPASGQPSAGGSRLGLGGGPHSPGGNSQHSFS